jgi:hypothetical protein
MTTRRKILFVCMQNSPHACRWINSLAGRGWDLHVFPIDSQPVLPSLRGVTVHPPYLLVRQDQLSHALRTPPRRWWADLADAQAAAHPQRLPHEPIFPLPVPHKVASALQRVRVRTGESEATSQFLYGPRSLARLIRRLKPDLIHSMEFQHCGYNVLRARECLGGRGLPPWLATNWGSDIYHFRQFADHRAQITRLLHQIDFYSCECERDIGIARELGMTAKVLPVMPNSGGFELASTERQRSLVPPSRRHLIMVKGYQHFAGRVLTALAALEHCADIVQGFDVVIFSSSSEAIERAAQLRASTPIKSITVLPFATHDQMLRMFAMARVYLGVSVSDAISTSALEAMAMGAFPIQTDTSCCNEWFEHGRGGYLIPPDDVDIIAERVRSALTDDHLVDQAAAINWQVISTRLDEREMQRRVWAFYDEIFADLDGRTQA